MQPDNPKENRRSSAPLFREALVAAGMAMLLRLVFWVYTGRMLDDALIAFLHSENAVRGLGLTHFAPGRPPVCAFSSPLVVIIALVGDLVHLGWGKHLVQFLSIPAAAAAIFAVRAIAIHESTRLPRPLAVLVMGYLAVEPHQILYGAAGMESQIAVAALLTSLYLLIAWRPLLLGVSLGVCMLIRPEFYLWSLIAAGYALWREPRQTPMIIGAAALVWAPWAVFAVSYFGSVVPHTVVAKSVAYGPLWWQQQENWSCFQFKRHIRMILGEQVLVFLSPAYAGHGSRIVRYFFSGPESPLADGVFLLALGGSFAAAVRRQGALIVTGVMLVSLAAFFVCCTPLIFHWYRVPFSALAVLLAAYGLHEMTRWLRPRWRKGIAWTATAAYLALFVALLPGVFRTERMLQQTCYGGVLRQAALKLGEIMGPDDVVGCEPLGTVAYYSRKQVWDWPGLASPNVVEYSRTHPKERTLENMLRTLQPHYLLLRDIEVCWFFADTRWLTEQYHPVAAFVTPEETLAQIPHVRNNVDMHFRIYQKNAPGDSRPYDRSLWPWPLQEKLNAAAPDENASIAGAPS